MNINKKQIGGILKVLETARKDKRVALENAKIVGYNDKAYLTATDGFMLAMLELNECNKNQIGKVITYKAIKTWYTLAKTSDPINNDFINENAIDDTFNYPDITAIMPNESQKTRQNGIMINSKYMSLCETIADDFLIYEFYRYGHMMAESNGNIFLIMQMKNRIVEFE